VIARANEVKVPLLMTSADTPEVMDIIEHLIARIDPYDKDTIDRIRKNIRLNVNLNAVWRL
jgi:BioD-like phosphotransacetylase family protein